MSAPRGKGLYERGRAELYAGRGYRSGADFAAAIDCDWIAVHGLNPERAAETTQEAFDLGLDVYLWSGPSSWLPSNWRRTLGHLAALADRFGVEGVIADPECARLGSECPEAWMGKQREAFALAEALGAVADTMSVGFTTFPSWPYWRDYARIAGDRGVWANPQLYGIREPRTTPAERAFHLKRWRETWPGRVVPAIGGWGRNAVQQAQHQQEFRGAQAAIFWTVEPPRRGTPVFEVMRSAKFGRPLWQKALGLAAVAGLGYGAWRYSQGELELEWPF